MIDTLPIISIFHKLARQGWYASELVCSLCSQAERLKSGRRGVAVAGGGDIRHYNDNITVSFPSPANHNDPTEWEASSSGFPCATMIPYLNRF